MPHEEPQQPRNSIQSISWNFLSLKWSVTEKFKDYLRTKPFVCYTDNNPLTYVFKTAKLDATAQRWVAQLEPYDFIVKYKPGVTNTVADALSRKYDTEEYDNTQQVKDLGQANIVKVLKKKPKSLLQQFRTR